MHRVELFGADPSKPEAPVVYELPADFTDCTPLQLGRIAALLSVPLPQDDVAREPAEGLLKMQLLRALTDMPDHLFGQLEVDDLGTIVEDELGIPRYVVLPQLNWALATPQWERSIVPTIEHAGTTWTGPTDRLARFTVLRWGFSDACHAAFLASGKTEDLDKLVAALYQHPERDWDNDLIEQHAVELREVPELIKLAALLNYQGLHAWLRARYPRSFEQGEGDGRGLLGLVVSIAGEKFGTVDQAGRANLHHVLEYSEQCIIQAEKVAAEQPAEQPTEA